MLRGDEPRSGRHFADLAFDDFDLDLSSCWAVIEILVPQGNLPGRRDSEFASFFNCGSSFCIEAGVSSIGPL